MSERDWLKYFLAKRNVGAVICEGPEIEAACAEIDRLHSDYAALLTRHNALKEAVVWERECNDASEAIYDDDGAKYDGEVEFENILSAARAEVDRMIGEK